MKIWVPTPLLGQENPWNQENAYLMPSSIDFSIDGGREKLEFICLRMQREESHKIPCSKDFSCESNVSFSIMHSGIMISRNLEAL